MQKGADENSIDGLSGNAGQYGTASGDLDVETLVSRTRRRDRRIRVLERAAATAVGALCLLPLLVALSRRGWFDDGIAYLVTASALVVGIAVVVWIERVQITAIQAATRLDEASLLPADVIRNSYEFAQIRAEERSDYHNLHLKQFRRFDGTLAKKAFPTTFPTVLAATPVLIVAALFIARWDPSPQDFARWTAPPPTPQASFVSASTLFEREQLDQLRDKVEATEDEELIEAFEELEDLLDSVEAGVDERLALEQLTELSERLESLERPKPPSLDEALNEASEELGEADETRPLADQLKSGDLDEAAQTLESLGENPESLSESAAEALREAAEALSPLDRSADRELSRAESRAEDADSQDESDATERALQQLEAERQENADEQGAEESRREELSRALRRLARESQRAARESDRARHGREESDNADGRQPDASQRAQEAARDGAEALRRQAGEQGASQMRESLSRRAESMRESVQRGSQRASQGGSGSSQRANDMREYLRRAGADVDSLPQPGTGQSGEQRGGSQGDPSGRESTGSGRQLRQLSREPGQQGGAGGERSSDQRSASRGGGAGGPGQEGSGRGEGHHADEFVNPTGRNASSRDLQVRGDDTGEGPSTSEVIFGAEDGGFSGVPYREVYQRYAEIRESVMERETIPSGYRYYVERYFELISPRTGN